MHPPQRIYGRSSLSTYQELQQSLALQSLEHAVLAIFTLDMMLRVAAEPWTYWLPFRGRGFFDALVTTLFYIPFGENSRSSVSLLCLLRLIHLSKVVGSIPQLRIIVMGMVGGFTAVGYIMFLLLFIYYIYAIIGVCMFQENDPWYFGDLPTAILTLFRASTLDSWSSILYIDFYGCQKFDGGIYHIIKEQNATRNLHDRTVCAHSREKPFLASLYWISFVVVASFVVMSLFVGSITMSMADSMKQLKKEEEEHRANMLRAKKVKALLRDFSVSDRRLTFIEPRRTITQRITKFLGLEMTLAEKVAARTRLAMILQQCLKIHDVAVVDVDQSHGPSQNSISEAYVRLSKICSKVTMHKCFSWFIYFSIAFSGILVGLKTSATTLNNNYATFSILGKIMLSIFSVDILLKIVAEGLYPLRFFKSAWNFIDVVIVLGSFCLKDNGWKFTLETLRLLRLLRMTKQFRSLANFQVIMNALSSGLTSVLFIGALLLLVIFIYAVLGVLLFGANDPLYFGSLHISSISLFRCATMDAWSDMMYTNMFGCDKYGYSNNSELCTLPKARGWWAVAYFVSYTIVSSLVLLTLFIGVVTTTMGEAQEQQRLYEDMEDKIDKFQNEQSIRPYEIDSYRAAFKILDLNESGFIEADELRVCLKSIGQDPSDKELFAMMKEVDADDSGELDLFEFIKFMVTATLEGRVADEAIADALQRVNITDGSTNSKRKTFIDRLPLLNRWGVQIVPTG